MCHSVCISECVTEAYGSELHLKFKQRFTTPFKATLNMHHVQQV